MSGEILVVDDDFVIRSLFRTVSDHFETPERADSEGRSITTYSSALGREIKVPFTEFDLSLVEDVLRNREYRAILLDGELLESEKDGVGLARGIQEGAYGSLNRNTPLYNISSSYEIPGTKKRFFKPSDAGLEDYFSDWGVRPVRTILSELGFQD